MLAVRYDLAVGSKIVKTRTTSDAEILAEGGMARPHGAVLEKSSPNSKKIGDPEVPGEAPT